VAVGPAAAALDLAVAAGPVPAAAQRVRRPRRVARHQCLAALPDLPRAPAAASQGNPGAALRVPAVVRLVLAAVTSPVAAGHRPDN
jgi:hypothetical protein